MVVNRVDDLNGFPTYKNHRIPQTKFEMIDERTEFQIAQLADGTLDEAFRPTVEELIAGSVQARELFDSYRKLDGALAASKVFINPESVSSDEVIAHID